MHQKKSRGRLSINLMANLLAFAIHAGIQFFVVPILSEQVGNEAYGFISIANEFVQYAQIFTVLLNGVVGRFVAYEIHKGDLKKANQYFNSVLIADVILSAVFGVIGIMFVSHVEHFLVVSPGILKDVRVIFALTFLNYIFVTLFSVMGVATFVKNRIDIAAIRNILGYFVELAVIVDLFLFTPVVKAYYLVAGTLVSTVYLAIANVVITIRLTPELHISLKNYKFEMMKDMLKTGVWSSISQLSSTLLGSTTIILANLFVGGNVVGLISLAKTLPNCMITLFYTIYNVFTPNMVKYYAKGKIDDMIEYACHSMKIMTFIMAPIVIGIFVFIPDFLELWLSGKSVEELQIIGFYCRIILLGMFFEIPSMPLMYFSVATNKVRNDTLFSLNNSIVLLILSYIGLKYFSLGGAVIVSSQMISTTTKFLLWVPMYAAKTVERKWNTFYPGYFKSFFSMLIVFMGYVCIKPLLCMDTWISFGLSAVSLGGLGYLLTFVMLFSRQEKKLFVRKIVEKIIKK